MILSHTTLRIVNKRDVQIEGEYSLTRNYLEIPNFTVSPSEKTGVFVVRPQAVIKSPVYVMLVQLNPNLLNNAEVSYQSIISPHDEGQYPDILVRPVVKGFDINDLNYLCRLFVVDGRLKGE